MPPKKSVNESKISGILDNKNPIATMGYDNVLKIKNKGLKK